MCLESIQGLVSTHNSNMLPTSAYDPRPRLGAPYLLFGIVLVLFGIFGAPVALCSVYSCVGSTMVVLVNLVMVGLALPGAILVFVGAFLLVKTGGPPHRPPVIQCPGCGISNPFSSGYCEGCGRPLHSVD